MGKSLSGTFGRWFDSTPRATIVIYAGGQTGKGTGKYNMTINSSFEIGIPLLPGPTVMVIIQNPAFDGSTPSPRTKLWRSAFRCVVLTAEFVVDSSNASFVMGAVV